MPERFCTGADADGGYLGISEGTTVSQLLTAVYKGSHRLSDRFSEVERVWQAFRSCTDTWKHPARLNNHDALESIRNDAWCPIYTSFRTRLYDVVRIVNRIPIGSVV